MKIHPVKYRCKSQAMIISKDTVNHKNYYDYFYFHFHFVFRDVLDLFT